MSTIGEDSLTGSSADELIRGLGGADTLAGNAGDDTISGGSGKDVLLGGKGEDLIKGGTGGDTLYGGQGDDSIKGGSGKDYLSGDFGADTLNGGSGDDVFVFHTRTIDGAVDTIEDFTDGEDRVELRDFIATDVTISDDGTDAFLLYEGNVIAVLEGAAATFDITDIDFV
jgi:Ca2+-binding RTX toxin-like protein